MMNHRKTQFARSVCAWGLGFFFAVVLGGCANGRGGGAIVAGRGPLAPDADASRAYVPLSKIEPSIQRPKRPDPLPPLSERGEKQIAAAKRLIEEQRYTEASLELERALRFDPNHYQIHRALTLLHWQAGNIERARTHAARALEGNPDGAAAHYVLGRCAAMNGDKAAALEALRTAVLCGDLDDDPEIATLCHYHLAQSLFVEGYLEAALGEYEAFEKSAGAVGSATPRLELAALLRSSQGKAGEERSRVLEKLGRPADAADALAPLVAAAPKDVERGKRFARLLSLAGRFDEALVAARNVPADDAEFVQFLFELHQRAGHPERIVDDLRERVAAKPDQPEPLLQLADALVRLGRQEDARAELSSFLQRNPSAAGVRTRLLAALEAAQDFSQVLAVCADGIRREPERTSEFEAVLLRVAKDRPTAEAVLAGSAGAADDAVSNYLRGIIARTAGKNDTAKDAFEKSLEGDRDFVPARAALAEIYLNSYRYDEVLRVAARVDSDRAEDARLERILGHAYDRLDDLERAEFHYRAATQRDRSDTESMYALAQLYRRSDKGLSAQRQLAVLLEKDPNHEAARESLAFTYLKENKADVALQQIDELRKRSQSPTTVARCRTLLEPEFRKDPAARRKLLMDALDEGAPDAVTWIAVAETYEDDEAAAKRDAYFKAMELDPQNEDAAFGAIRTTKLLLQFEEAAERLERLLPLRPNRHEWRLSLIELHSIAQNYDKALSLSRESAEREDTPEAKRKLYRLALCGTLLEADRAKEAVEQLKIWSQAEPDNRDWKLRLAEAYLGDDQPGEAALIYEDLVRTEERDRAPRADLITALAVAKRHDRALQFVLDWLNDDPENDQLVSMLASLLADAERQDDAFEVVRTRLLRTPNREWFQDFVARRLAATKRYDEAIEWVESLIEELLDVLRSAPNAGGRRRPLEKPPEDRVVFRPNQPSTAEALHDRLENLRAELARELILSERYRDAEQQINGWLASLEDPQARARYLLELADCQRSQGQETQAGTTLEKVLALIPNHPTLNNDIAYLWIDRGERLDEAGKMIRYALGRAPRQAAYLDTYGWLLYKLGDFAGAKKWLLRANHSRDGKDPVIHDHLGDTLWQLGDRAEAIEHWRTALERSRERTPDARINADEQRVRTETPKKIEEGGAGRSPAVAPKGGESPTKSGAP